MSKLIEIAVIIQLVDHLINNNLNKKFRFAKRQSHSTESAILRSV